MLTVFATASAAGVAHASSITVGEFRWDSLTPDDPDGLSLFTLTNVWNGPAPAVTLVDNELSLPDGNIPFFDVGPDLPFNFDQFAVAGTPAFASISTSFFFAGELRTLAATLTAPDTFAVLQFDPPAAPVPEPGTLTLLGLGLACAARRLKRVSQLPRFVRHDL
jgi:hypothetical protein